MKIVFLTFLLLNFCQPQAATLQLSGVVREMPVVCLQPDPQPCSYTQANTNSYNDALANTYKRHRSFFIHPRKDHLVQWAPISGKKERKWKHVWRVTLVKKSCHIRVTAL